MYETTFQLDRRPFLAVPSTDGYFPATSIENARTALVRLIQRDEGPGLVVGPVGIGKSLLAQLLSETLKPEFLVALIPSARICTRRTLLQVLLHQFGLPFQDLAEGELRLSLIDLVTSDDLCPNGAVIIVDEADSLPMALLDELRTMTNTVSSNRHCIRLVLIGSTKLEEKVGHPRLESLNQRIAGRYYVEPFDREETIEYIAGQIEKCGGDPSLLFTKDALDTVYHATNGVPRLINQMCDHAFILAAADGIRKIDTDLMNRAWADLQQLPAPSMDRFHRLDEGSGVVEFGELDETDDGSHSPQIASIDPFSKLDELQEVVNSIDDDESPVTLQFQQQIDQTTDNETTSNPFDEQFEREEIVLDGFIAAKIVAKRASRNVQCEQSEFISASVSAIITGNLESKTPDAPSSQIPFENPSSNAEENTKDSLELSSPPDSEWDTTARLETENLGTVVDKCSLDSGDPSQPPSHESKLEMRDTLDVPLPLPSEESLVEPVDSELGISEQIEFVLPQPENDLRRSCQATADSPRNEETWELRAATPRDDHPTDMEEQVDTSGDFKVTKDGNSHDAYQPLDSSQSDDSAESIRQPASQEMESIPISADCLDDKWQNRNVRLVDIVDMTNDALVIETVEASRAVNDLEYDSDYSIEIFEPDFTSYENLTAPTGENTKDPANKSAEQLDDSAKGNSEVEMDDDQRLNADILDVERNIVPMRDSDMNDLTEDSELSSVKRRNFSRLFSKLRKAN